MAFHSVAAFDSTSLPGMPDCFDLYLATNRR